MNSDQLKQQIQAFAPLIISALTLTNTFLSMKGLPCIEIDNANITQAVSAIATIVSVVWAWWQNNNVTGKSQVSQKVLSALKSGTVTDNEVEEFLDDKTNPAPAEEKTVKEEVKEAVQHSEDLDGQV